MVKKIQKEIKPSVQISVSSKERINILNGIFGNIHKFSNDIVLIFSKNRLYIQGMDSSHVCVYEISLTSAWFDEYVVDLDINVGVQSSMLCLVMGIRQEHQSIWFEYSPASSDKFDILFKNNPEFQDEIPREFNIPTMTIEQELMHIPDMPYPASIVLPSKTFSDIISPLQKFGDSVTFYLSPNCINLQVTEGTDGDIIATLLDDDQNLDIVKEYKMTSTTPIILSLSIRYMLIFCAFHKISKLVTLNIVPDNPFQMKYILDCGDNGDENNDENYMRLYLAPKVDEHE